MISKFLYCKIWWWTFLHGHTCTFIAIFLFAMVLKFWIILESITTYRLRNFPSTDIFLLNILPLTRARKNKIAAKFPCPTSKQCFQSCFKEKPGKKKKTERSLAMILPGFYSPAPEGVKPGALPNHWALSAHITREPEQKPWATSETSHRIAQQWSPAYNPTQ